MISLTVDLNNTLSVLRNFADDSILQLAANAAAESWNDDVLDWIGSGQSFTPRNGGGLEQSISWHGNGDGSATVYTQKEYANYVEKGTGEFIGHSAWVIKPKEGRKALKIPNGGVSSPVGPQLAGGGYVLRRSVIHHGSRPLPFMFADVHNRSERMKQRILSVLMRAYV